MNKVILIGNLTRDPELTQTSGGISRCAFSIAVNRQYAGTSGERVADFFSIVAWRGLGESCHKYLKKGGKVCICGEINLRHYEADGAKKIIVDIVANEVEFLTRSNADSETSSNPPRKKESTLTPIDDDSLPF